MSSPSDRDKVQGNKTKRITVLAVLLGIGVALHALEALIPFNMLPGMKLGFANIVTLVTLYVFGFSSTLTLAVLRVLMGSLLSGTFMSSSSMLALSGAICASFGMGITISVFKGMISPYSLSIVGSMCHNIGQLCAFMLLAKSSNVIVYFPYLALVAIPTGLLIGLCSKYCLKSLSISERGRRRDGLSNLYGRNFYIYCQTGGKPVPRNEVICCLSVIVLGLLFLFLTGSNLISGKKVRYHGNEEMRIVVRTMNGDTTEEVFACALSDIANKGTQYIDVDGQIGVSILEIDSEKGIRFVESPCRDKLCMGFGWVYDEEDFAACLPNGITVTVEP